VDRAGSSASTGPPSSTGSPTTFRIRPSVALPTGTVIGPPVSVTACAAHEALGRVHRDGAHGVFAEVLRDLQNRRLPLLSVSSAFRISGR
jgi:hypothetical protein